MHFVTIIEMSKATLLIGTGTFLWIRGNGYEERFFFFLFGEFATLWTKSSGEGDYEEEPCFWRLWCPVD